MQDPTYSIPIIRITPSSIVVYRLNEENFTRSKDQILNEENLTRGEFNGFMSPKTKSKVKRYLDTWFNSIEQMKRNRSPDKLDKKPYLTFVTLTLPSKQVHTDNQIKRKCLTPFIETLKRKYNVWNYFWRAESQENGNIHFHIICDSYVKWQELREEWNVCINKLEYVDRFREKWGHGNPNSTDIHKLNEIKSITAYVIKYCSKDDGYRKIEGRIHGCSDSIRKLMPYEFIVESKDHNLIASAIAEKGAYVRDEDSFTYIGLAVYPFLKKIRPDLIKKMNEYYVSIGKSLYTNETREKYSDKLMEDEKEIKEKSEITEMINTIDLYAQLNIDYRYCDFVSPR